MDAYLVALTVHIAPGNNPLNASWGCIHSPAFRASSSGIGVVLNFIGPHCLKNKWAVSRAIPIDLVSKVDIIIGNVLKSHVCIECRTRTAKYNGSHHLNWRSRNTLSCWFGLVWLCSDCCTRYTYIYYSAAHKMTSRYNGFIFQFLYINEDKGPNELNILHLQRQN